MQIKDCTCRGPVEERRMALTNAILVYTCGQCGGGLAGVADYLHGIEQRVEQLKADLYETLGEIPPPGRAVVTTCDECGGHGCRRCGDTGKQLWRACPKCGDIGFDFINGQNETEGMVCRIGCGFKWAPDDPRWLAQRLAIIPAPSA